METFFSKCRMMVYQNVAEYISAIESVPIDWSLKVNDRHIVDDNASLLPSSYNRGPVLNEFIARVKDFSPKFWEESIAKVEDLCDKIDDGGVQCKDVRRKQRWGARGHRLSMPRVYRGQLGRAWRQSYREAQLGNTGTVTLLINGGGPSLMSASKMFWNAATTLALASKLEASGRRVDLIWISAYKDTFVDPSRTFNVRRNPDVKDNEGLPHGWHAVYLKRGSQPWNIQEVIASTHVAWFRRLAFRTIELSAHANSSYVEHNYGVPPNGQTVKTLALQWLADQGISEDAVICGPGFDADISGAESASKWMNDAINAIDNNEEDN